MPKMRNSDKPETHFRSMQGHRYSNLINPATEYEDEETRATIEKELPAQNGNRGAETWEKEKKINNRAELVNAIRARLNRSRRRWRKRSPSVFRPSY